MGNTQLGANQHLIWPFKHSLFRWGAYIDHSLLQLKGEEWAFGKKLQRVSAVLVTIFALLIGGMNGAMAATIPAPPPAPAISEIQMQEGWNGKEILACHGWLDTYISGRHVAHYNPDLIPRGGPVSIGCAYAGCGVIVSFMGPVGAIGWLPMVWASSLRREEWSFLVDKVKDSPWSAIIMTQLLAALGLLALLVRFDAPWYDYFWVLALVVYEVLVIRALVRRVGKSPET
ncbi:hypothetical protein AB6813_07240 [bacterium RCC_150]